jgi:two-component system sensor histidine kinase KdpD
MIDPRPDPDALLGKVQREEEQRKRGRLKIFFGACAGVGKTYAMLSAARTLRGEGLDVVIGVVETHGRVETGTLLDGLDRLPLCPIEYRGRRLGEFDIDGALKRHPAVILVDELAHSNAPGSRHHKRWQDVEELLNAGIDVYTTLNVQHLETLNDVVGQITGIRVAETLPDTVFEHADEVVLVDLPPDELLRRLKEGKVYVPEQARHAIRNFFRKGNLIALRELSLRRTADRVDAQMREYRSAWSIQSVWQAKERLLVCISPEVDAEKIVRNAGHFADTLHADWIALYVETPELQRAPHAARQRALDAIRLAQELGGEGTTLAADDMAAAIIGYARSRNVSRIVVGRGHRSRLSQLFRPSLSERLGALATDIDIIVIAAPPKTQPVGVDTERADTGFVFEPVDEQRPWHYVWAILICVATTLLAMPLALYFHLVNIIMLYFLGVVVAAFRFGRRPGILASVLSVVAFDFFFVPPVLSFTVADTQYLVTFAVMLGVAVTVSNLAANLRYQARVSMLRERRASALYEMGRELSGALVTAQIVEIARRHITGTFQAGTWLLLSDLNDKLALPKMDGGGDALVDASIAQWVFDNGQPAGLGTNTLAGALVHYLPLKAPMRTRGVLAVRPGRTEALFLPEQYRLLETFAAQIALALERVHYVEIAQQALVRIESERLRNSLLGALSHDLRTPLTALVGLADTLKMALPSGDQRERELAVAIRDEALRMNDLVNNLLDMARLQSGEVHLNRQWQPLEEVIGTALRARQAALTGHRVRTLLPAHLPLVEIDSVLIERVLCNLLENTAKYTPAGSDISIRAAATGAVMEVAIADNGPGIPPEKVETIFDKFTRGERESAIPGVGLGLAICRAIIEAHGGKIWAENPAGGGARFIFTLPLGTPPPEPDFEDDAVTHPGVRP